MGMVERLNAVVSGPSDGRPTVFTHGFGCDPNMWRFVAPHFAADFRVVLFDHVGAGPCLKSAYDPERYSTLAGYADDVLELLWELDRTAVAVVDLSVSASIGVLAATAD